MTTDVDTPKTPAKKNGATAGALKTLATLVSRANFFARLGFTHDGARDLYEVFGYKRSLTTRDYYEKYLRQDIAARVVDAFPTATWANPPIIEGNPRFNTDWQNLNAKFKVFTIFQRLDRLLGLGDYAVLLIGLNDGRKLDQPARARPKQEIIYLQPYSSSSMAIQGWDENASSPRYGLPEMYVISADDVASTNQNQVAFKRKQTDVHWSRCVHIVEDPLENEVYGIARLQRVYNILDDLLKVCGGTAETYWLTANRGIQADVDKDMSFSEADAQDLSDEIEEYVHKLRRVIRTRGVKVTSLGSDVPDPRGVFDILVTMLAGALGIPKRILLGSEAGQLASEQDRTNWANRIEERRANFAEPAVLWPFFNRLIDLKLIRPGPQKFTWPSSFRMSPLERAQTAAQKARSAANLFKLFPTAQPEVPGLPAVIDKTGKEVKPATPGKPAVEGTELLSVDEARRIILTDEIQPETFDEPKDVARTET